MKRYLISTFCLSLILTAQAWGQGEVSTTVAEAPAVKDSKFSADWRLRMAGADIHDVQTESKFVDLRLDVRSKYILTSDLYVDLQPSIRMVSGQTQVIDGADPIENKILLNQAALHYNPSPYTLFTAGALNQRHMHTSLLIDDMAFPAARAEAQYRSSSYITSFGIETAIPTSTSLSTNTKEIEPTPSLNSASFKFTYQPNRYAAWKVSLGYFAYANLPSSVAQQSLLLGNDVNQISDANYKFAYEYQGPEASTYLQLPVFSRFDLIMGAEYLENVKAPSDSNMAYKVYGGGNIRITKGLEWTLLGGYFSVGPDSAVAYFNANGFETNRVGYSAETFLTFKKERFNIGFKYTDAETIFTNTVQTREKTLMIKLETFYANI